MEERTILFIDGENLLYRFQSMLEVREPTNIRYHSPNRYIWHGNLTRLHRVAPYRVLYYTSQSGDTKALEQLEKEISSLRYKHFTQNDRDFSVSPRVFKKEKNSAKTKSVDINLTTDLLRFAMNGSIDRAIVVSGDGDYIPVYQEVMRHGVRVTVAALSSGCNPRLESSVDLFINLDDVFFKKL